MELNMYEEVYKAAMQIVTNAFGELSDSDLRIGTDEIIIGLAFELINIREEEEHSV